MNNININHFNNVVMGYATPILDKLAHHVNTIRERHNRFVICSSKDLDSHIPQDHILNAALKEGIKVLPIAIGIFAMITMLSTPALSLVGATATTALVSQPDLLNEEGKLRLVAASLSANLVFTAVKTMTALATLNLSAALLTANVGGAVSIGLYAAYKWLSAETELKKT